MKKLLVVFTLSVCMFSCVDEKDPGPIPLIKYPHMKNGTRVCFIGDTGIGSSTQYLVANALSKESCDQVRVLGDVIYGDGIQSKDDIQLKTKFFEPYKSLLDQSIPFYMIMGNHDHNGNVAPWLDVAREHKAVYFPNYYYAEIWGDVCFFGIETNAYFSSQKSWLKKLYAEIKSQCQLTIGYAHHPYKSSGGHGDAKNLDKKFLEDTLIGKVDAYLSGHDHIISYEGKSNGTHLFISGSGAKRRHLERAPLPGNYAEAELGYVILTVNRDSNGVQVKYEFRKVTNDNVETSFSGSFKGQGLR